MTRSPKQHWLAAAGLVLAALACAGCQPFNGSNGSNGSSSSSGSSDGSGGSDHVEKSSYQITQVVSEISLDGNAGDVQVMAGDGPISVTETARYTDDKPPTSHTVNGATLTLTEGECQHERTVHGSCQVDWEVHAPAGTNLTLEEGAGNITVTEFSGTVSAKPDSGNITVTGLSGTVSAETDSGNVKGERLTSRSVTAKSSSGNVDLAFTQPPDQAKASSSSGNVDVELPDGTGYAVDAHTDSGDRRVNVTQDDNSPHKIDAKTNSGSVEINNP